MLNHSSSSTIKKAAPAKKPAAKAKKTTRAKPAAKTAVKHK